MIKDGIIINKNSPNEYDSFYKKLSSNNDNINPRQQYPRQQPSATYTSSRFLSNTFTLPQDNTLLPK